jgi:hypothetical protein
MLERAALVVMSIDGAVEIVVGHQCKLVLSDAVARHFAIKAMELIAARTNEVPSPAKRMSETAEKLIYYVAFTVRSRTQATAMSMRSMSMFMMVFMMMTSTPTHRTPTAPAADAPPHPIGTASSASASTALRGMHRWPLRAARPPIPPAQLRATVLAAPTLRAQSSPPSNSKRAATPSSTPLTVWIRTDGASSMAGRATRPSCTAAASRTSSFGTSSSRGGAEHSWRHSASASMPTPSFGSRHACTH